MNSFTKSVNVERKSETAYPLKYWRKIWNCIVAEHLLTFTHCCCILSGIILGVILKLSKPKWTPREMLFLEWPKYFGNSLPRLFVLPLFMSSALASTGSTRWPLTRSILLMIIPLFMTLLYVATCLGIIFALIIRPGLHNKPVPYPSNRVQNHTFLFVDDMLDVFRQCRISSSDSNSSFFIAFD